MDDEPDRTARKVQRQSDISHDAQLLRDLAIVNTRTVRDLGPLPAGGLPIEPKRRPTLSKPIADTQETTTMTKPDSTATTSNGLPAPPIPQRLREMLKDYPEHLQRLQQALNHSVDPTKVHVMPFDEAIWALEGALGTFISEAREELKQAEVVGNPESIEQARAKELLMLHARGLRGLDDLRAYFQTQGGV